MEILAIYPDLLPKIILCGIITVVAILLLYVAFGAGVLGDRKTALVISAIAFLLLLTWFIPAETHYDAIITDWNVVHEQGYEIVETNGKIVTLRKEGD